MFGREVLLQGLVKFIGDGKDTKVWLENWILDGCSRTPIIRIALLTSHYVCLIKPVQGQRDKLIWSLTKEGIYTSKSGYQLLESLKEMQEEHTHTLPPVEKKLWSNLWRINAPPKLKHFLWKALAGALAVKERLQDPYSICTKALDETDVWLRVNSQDQNLYAHWNPPTVPATTWKKPPLNMSKCNIGVLSWVGPNRHCGVSWILRDFNGTALIHSRRSYTFVPSQTKAELMAILSAAESLRNMNMSDIIFESSFILYIGERGVTRDQRYQSGPSWLHAILFAEAEMDFQ
ncbi:unnamed protein product [Microthlaspi erraticum]|uniref:Uncharacterized protein n=1 Tax=Microthlaspi erraticum TaxID=1685480 RepID=A0A6D2HVZ3_9BRAS|nr:unnamed protein product [Microthlaspi erraticum]